jgi:APA family basic amino acid/polyamine antiporter
MVGIKLLAILISFRRLISGGNLQLAAFHAQRLPGVLTGAALVFFTYIGFDSVSTAAEECKRPQRDLPIGIIASLGVCTVLYIAVAVVLTGIGDYRQMNNAAPVVNALHAWVISTPAAGWCWRRRRHAQFPTGLPVRAGAGVVRHVARRAAAEAFFQGASAAPDPVREHMDRRLGRWHPGRHLGHRHLRGSVQHRHAVRLHGGIGRSTRSEKEAARTAAGFRVPLVPLLPWLSILSCLGLMMGLPILTWLRFLGWMAIGLGVYFLFGFRRSQLAE